MICFIFGTFNPPTIAHMNLGVLAKRALGDNCRVVYVPDTTAYMRQSKGFKDGDIMPDKDRLRLLTELCYSYDFEVAFTEYLEITDGKAYDTVVKYRDPDKWLCIGADLVESLPMWYKSSELLNMCGLLVVQRKGDSGYMGTELGCRTREYRFVDVDDKYLGVSSTAVRNAYKAGNLDSVKWMLDREVYEYLEVSKNVYI